MLDYRKRLSLIDSRVGAPSRHGKLASRVLTQLGRSLKKLNIKYKDDLSWPYHIIVPYGPKFLSLHCGGFTKRIEIQRLTTYGIPARNSKEVAYMTPKGATNYVKRILDKVV